MPFLNSEYRVPAGSSQFMKLQEGQNRFRILTDARVGWEGWKDNKPFRREGNEKNILDHEVDFDYKFNKSKINHFWVFAVWNVSEQKCQILQITQSTIMRAIQNYIILEEYGDPKGYDLIITRGKEGDKTVYQVAAMPPRETPPEALEALLKSKIDLDKLFVGEYPMQATEDVYDTDPLMN